MARVRPADYPLSEAEKLQGYTLLCAHTASSNQLEIEALEASSPHEIAENRGFAYRSGSGLPARSGPKRGVDDPGMRCGARVRTSSLSVGVLPVLYGVAAGGSAAGAVVRVYFFRTK